jgi:hypothetical protein
MNATEKLTNDLIQFVKHEGPEGIERALAVATLISLGNLTPEFWQKATAAEWNAAFDQAIKAGQLKEKGHGVAYVAPKVEPTMAQGCLFEF